MKGGHRPSEVPRHRVVRSKGEIGGFMGKAKGREIEQRKKLLRQEGNKVYRGKK